MRRIVVQGIENLESGGERTCEVELEINGITDTVDYAAIRSEGVVTGVPTSVVDPETNASEATKVSVPPHVRERILSLYMDGAGVNHVVFLLNYEYNIDLVNAVIRKRLRELTTFAFGRGSLEN